MATTPKEFEAFSPEMRQLISLVENNLHFIAGVDMTRSQAIVVRERLLLPIGKMTSKYGIPKPIRAKDEYFRSLARNSVDNNTT